MNKKDIGIIIQARIGSKRLPGKMILPFYNRKGILELLLERIAANFNNINIIVATSDAADDDFIEAIAASYNISVYRGSEDDVLSRFIGAAQYFGIDRIIRVCADNPFLDMDEIRWQIEQLKNTDFDYFCFCLSDLTPTIKTHFGFWTEAVTLKTLEKIAQETDSFFFREHVTNYIYFSPDKFKIHYTHVNKEIEKACLIRLTVDSPQDFDLAKEIYVYLITNSIPFKALNLTRLINDNSGWLDQMASQIQKNTK